MSTKCGNTYAGCTDFHVRVHNLACFVIHLHFFFGITVFREHVDLRNQVECQLISKLLYCHRLVGQYLTVLFVQLVHSGSTGTAGSLISRYVHGFYMRKLFDGFQCNYHLDSCTVRIGNDATRTLQRICGIYFGHYQRHISVHTESAGVVDHHSTVFGDCFLELLGCSCTGRSESNVYSFKVIVVL